MHRPFLAILSFVVACAACRAAEVPILAITHVNVIPVVRPGLLEDYTVVVVGGIIETVAPSAQVAIPSNAEVLDCTDATLEDWNKMFGLVTKPDQPEDKPPLQAVGDRGAPS